MKKIPTIFIRDMSQQPALVMQLWREDCEWVRDGEGRPTLKLDGTCCMVRDGVLYKRREVKRGQKPPPDFEQADYDDETGKTVGWVPVGDGPDDKYHREAFRGERDGTYELLGPKVQGGKEKREVHVLEPHGCIDIEGNPRTYNEIRIWLDQHHAEGIVWHHPDGRMAKIKRRDFGFKW